MSKGFEAWKQQHAEKGADLSRDAEAYRQYLAAATGQAAQERAGMVTTGEHSVGAVDFSGSASITDDQAYALYTAELNGEASRRRAVENVTREGRDRQAEHRRHAEHHGTPVPDFYQDGV